MQALPWSELEPTDVHIRGYSGIAETCCGKSRVKMQMGSKFHDEDVFFSNQATSNFLSREACKAFGIIPKGFPHEQLNSVKAGAAKYDGSPNVRFSEVSEKSGHKYIQNFIRDES